MDNLPDEILLYIGSFNVDIFMKCVNKRFYKLFNYVNVEYAYSKDSIVDMMTTISCKYLELYNPNYDLGIIECYAVNLNPWNMWVGEVGIPYE